MFKVLKNLRHDGTDYQSGDPLEIGVEKGMIMVEKGILEFIDDGRSGQSLRLDRDDRDGVVNYDDMTVPQLKEVAKQKGVDVKGMLRDEIIDILKNPIFDDSDNEEEAEGEEGEGEEGETEDDTEV